MEPSEDLGGMCWLLPLRASTGCLLPMQQTHTMSPVFLDRLSQAWGSDTFQLLGCVAASQGSLVRGVLRQGSAAHMSLACGLCYMTGWFLWLKANDPRIIHLPVHSIA